MGSENEKQRVTQATDIQFAFLRIPAVDGVVAAAASGRSAATERPWQIRVVERWSAVSARPCRVAGRVGKWSEEGVQQ